MKFVYHPDHLGSASFVTNIDGYVMQHLQYLPYGELFVSQRNSEEFDSRYKFTAKELDNETSYTYFGARYYDSELSGWLSVDPMSDERRWVSPYAYCQWNPVVLVDPRGMLDDWYRDDETGATFWHEGSESFIEIDGVRYRNIGATYSKYSNGIRIDFQQNEVVNVIDVDPNFNLEGGQYIPRQFTTDDGQVVFVDFSYTTMDGNNAYNAISIDAVSLLITSINYANNNDANIYNISISATTNGTHSANSAHYVRNGARAFDINKINNISVRNTSSHDMVDKIQKGMMLNKLNSENYGPNIQISYGKPVKIEGHEGHIHGAVKRNY